MIKVITFLKRRPGMSMADFKDYYEARHTLLGRKYLGGLAVRYVRRYLEPIAGPLTAAVEAEADVIMEAWFPDRDALERAFAGIAAPDAQAEIIADEERLFDRAKTRVFFVEEHETDLAG